MRRLIILGALFAILALPTSAAAGGRPFVLQLSGAAERPGPGDPDGSGTAWLWVNPGQGEVCFALEVQNITLPTVGAHIHKAPATDPGPIVIPLIAPDSTGASSGCVSADRSLLIDILVHPSDYYVNVHTLPLYGAGAVRAQLAR